MAYCIVNMPLCPYTHLSFSYIYYYLYSSSWLLVYISMACVLNQKWNTRFLNTLANISLIVLLHWWSLAINLCMCWTISIGRRRHMTWDRMSKTRVFMLWQQVLYFTVFLIKDCLILVHSKSLKIAMSISWWISIDWNWRQFETGIGYLLPKSCLNIYLALKCSNPT